MNSKKYLLLGSLGLIISGTAYYTGVNKALASKTSIVSTDEKHSLASDKQNVAEVSSHTNANSKHHNSIHAVQRQYIKTGILSKSVRLGSYTFSALELAKARSELINDGIVESISDYDLARILFLQKQNKLSLREAYKMYFY